MSLLKILACVPNIPAIKSYCKTPIINQLIPPKHDNKKAANLILTSKLVCLSAAKIFNYFLSFLSLSPLILKAFMISSRPIVGFNASLKSNPLFETLFITDGVVGIGLV